MRDHGAAWTTGTSATQAGLALHEEAVVLGRLCSVVAIAIEILSHFGTKRPF